MGQMPKGATDEWQAAQEDGKEEQQAQAKDEPLPRPSAVARKACRAPGSTRAA
jgi:hypothetical protein